LQLHSLERRRSSGVRVRKDHEVPEAVVIVGAHNTSEETDPARILILDRLLAGAVVVAAVRCCEVGIIGSIVV
jgi:hypothetical protein